MKRIIALFTVLFTASFAFFPLQWICKIKPVLIPRCLLDVSESCPFSYNLQRLFFHMMISSCRSVDSSDLIRMLHYSSSSSAFDVLNHFISTLQLEKSPISSLFCGKQLNTKQCLNCHSVFYSPDFFTILVSNCTRLITRTALLHATVD